MKIVQFHDESGNMLLLNADLFCAACSYSAPEPPEGMPVLNLHTAIACINGYGLKVQESIEKVYRILKEVA